MEFKLRVVNLRVYSGLKKAVKQKGLKLDGLKNKRGEGKFNFIEVAQNPKNSLGISCQKWTQLLSTVLFSQGVVTLIRIQLMIKRIFSLRSRGVNRTR